MLKLLNFGSCNIDYVYTMDHIVSVGETEATFRLELFPGGKGLNQSIAAARAGAEVYHAGCIGSDGELLLQTLSDSGVDLSFLREVPVKSGHAIIQVSKQGENAIFLYPGANETVDEAMIDGVLANFSSGDFLLLQNEISGVPLLVEKAFARGLSIVLNPSPCNERILEIDFQKLSYLILNEVEAKAISGSDSPKDALLLLHRKYPKLKVVLTLGKDGCLYSDGRQILRHPAFCVEAVDTTAAGDTFTGYFLASLMKERSVEASLRIASAASAIAVSRMGAAPSIPSEDEVLSALERLVPYGNSSEDPVKAQILRYLQDRLCDATLSSLADSFGYSKGYMGSLVKSLTGQTFTELLRDLRCRGAARLLEETDLPIAEIIESIGYKNESFFRKHFQSVYGKSPRAYRNFIRGER